MLLSLNVTLLLAVSLALAQPHSGDLWLAVSAGGQLKFSPRGFVPDGTADAVVVLEETHGPLLFGWTDNNPGFDDIEQSDPENDCYPLAPGAQVWLEIVQVDPAFVVWDVQLRPYFTPGDRVYLGSSPGQVHTHLIWHINSQYPNFQQLYGLKVRWRAQFRLVDTGGTAYMPSNDFPMIFATVSCTPGDINDDGQVGFGDINPFINVMSAPQQADARQRCAADVNLDGWADFGDINPFVKLLAGL